MGIAGPHQLNSSQNFNLLKQLINKKKTNKLNSPSGLFMLRDDRTSPNKVALKSTIPSSVRGIFMVTSLCNKVMNSVDTN